VRIGLAAFLLLAAGIVPAAAQDGSAANRFLSEALQKREAGDDAAAVPLFEQAASLYHKAQNARGEAAALEELASAFFGSLPAIPETSRPKDS